MENTGPCAPFSKPERLAQRLHVCTSAYHNHDMIFVARRIRGQGRKISLGTSNRARVPPQCRPLIPHAYAPGLRANARARMIRWMFWGVEDFKDAIERSSKDAYIGRYLTSAADDAGRNRRTAMEQSATVSSDDGVRFVRVWG